MAVILWKSENINLSDFEEKVITLFFFGHGCSPCRGIAPPIQDQLSDPYSSNDDYAILGLDVWDGNSSVVDAFETATEVSFPLLLNASSVARDFHYTPKWSTNIIYKYSNDPFLTERTSAKWLGVRLKHKLNRKNSLQVFAGNRRGGPACQAGVCYEILDFSSVETRFTSRF